MLPHNAHRHLQKKPSVCTPLKKRNIIRIITFFSLFVGVLGLATLLSSVAMAASYKISIESAKSVTEAPGGTQIQFDVTLNPQVLVPGDQVTVDYDMTDVEAVDGSDYTATNGTLTWEFGDPKV